MPEHPWSKVAWEREMASCGHWLAEAQATHRTIANEKGPLPELQYWAALGQFEATMALVYATRAAARRGE